MEKQEIIGPEMKIMVMTEACVEVRKLVNNILIQIQLWWFLQYIFQLIQGAQPWSDPKQTVIRTSKVHFQVIKTKSVHLWDAEILLMTLGFGYK